ncbi:hypothetical protein CCMA1212_006883 [Trichoderma ghanense]|uniref:Uncharacterized protein n=1 Tax=Trichoderma ghanense TaxID=65468 RepID=A0ABY2H0R6_9HYPO
MLQPPSGFTSTSRKFVTGTVKRGADWGKTRQPQQLSPPLLHSRQSPVAGRSGYGDAQDGRRMFDEACPTSVCFLLSSDQSVLASTIKFVTASSILHPVDRSRCPSLPTRDIPFHSLFLLFPFRLDPLPFHPLVPSSFVLCFFQDTATKRRSVSLLLYEARGTGFEPNTNQIIDPGWIRPESPPETNPGLSATEKGGAASGRTGRRREAFAGEPSTIRSCAPCPTTADDTIIP